MNENIENLFNYYLTYEKIILLENRISILMKIDYLEKKVILTKNSDDIVKFILSTFSVNSNFVKNRFSFILTQKSISTIFFNEISELIFQEIKNTIDTPILPTYIINFIDIIGILKLNSFENTLYEILNLKNYKKYQKNILISLVKITSSEKILDILLYFLKKNNISKKILFLCIGYIASSENAVISNRKVFKPYLNYVKKILFANRLSEDDLSGIYFSIIKIYSIKKEIDGILTNKISEALLLNKKDSLIYKLALKRLNNVDFYELEIEYINNFFDKKTSKFLKIFKVF